MSGRDAPPSVPAPLPPKRRTGWQLIGAVVAVIAVVVGVAAVAFFILIMIAFSNYGSSK